MFRIDRAHQIYVPRERLEEISCPVGASRGVVVSIDNPVGRDIVLASKVSVFYPRLF